MKSLFKEHLLKLQRARTSVGRDIEGGLCLDRNERPTKFPDKVLDEMLETMSGHVLNFYPDPSGLYKKLSRWLDLPQEQIYVTNGITEGIRIVFETLSRPKDEVVITDPTYPMYRIYSEIYETACRSVYYGHDLKLRFEEILDVINDNTTLVCIANPNLPIESVIDPDAIGAIAEKCQRHNAAFVIDEAYSFFGAPSVIKLVNKYDNLIVLQTFAKAFGLAGIRLGYMVSKADNIDYLSKTRSIVETNSAAVAIGEYMLDHIEILHDFVRQVKEGRDYIRREMDRLRIRWFGGEYTNAILFFMKDKTEVSTLIGDLKKQKIYIRGSFGPPIENCARLTIAPKEEMKIFVDAFGDWLEQKRK